MSYQGQVQNKPTAAYVLSLLGGIFGLLAGLGVMASGALLYNTYSSATDFYGNPIDATGLFGFSWSILVGFGIWMLITSILIMVFAGKLKSEPMEHSKWGALILVFSIIGVGGLFGLIGGILALVYKPIPVQSIPQPYTQPAQSYPPQYSQQPPQQQRITRICPQCGRVLDEDTRFCPHCGKQLE